MNVDDPKATRMRSRRTLITSHGSSLFTEVIMDAAMYGWILKLLSNGSPQYRLKNHNKTKEANKKKAKRIEMAFWGASTATSVEKSVFMRNWNQDGFVSDFIHNFFIYIYKHTSILWQSNSDFHHADTV